MTPLPSDRLDQLLQSWVDAELIEPSQAHRIAAHEANATPRVPAAPPDAAEDSRSSVVA